jgi:hypothetical protein
MADCGCPPCTASSPPPQLALEEDTYIGADGNVWRRPPNIDIKKELELPMPPGHHSYGGPVTFGFKAVMSNDWSDPGVHYYESVWNREERGRRTMVLIASMGFCPYSDDWTENCVRVGCTCTLAEES